MNFKSKSKERVKCRQESIIKPGETICIRLLKSPGGGLKGVYMDI